MGKLADIKTKPTAISVTDFINTVADEQKKADSFVLLELMENISGEKPKMWGASMIGFGDLRYKSPASGREVDWFKIGFSPSKANLSVHLCSGVQMHTAALEKLGKHKLGSGCIYINKLSDVDIKVLESIIIETLKKK